MKRLYTLLILTLLIGLKVQGQTYFTPGIPPGSTSFSPTYRFIGTDSLFKLFIANGNRTSQVYTAAQVNALLGTVLPSQTGNSGKYLTTNGTIASWAALSGSGTVTSVGSGYGLLGGPITTTGTLLVDTNKIALSDDRILSGMVTTATGTTATTTAGSYRLSGTVYTLSSSTNTTIPAQDATLSRFSVIYANTSSALNVVNGTLAANPDVPSIPSGTLLVSTILITPTGITPTPPPAGKVNANSGLTLKNNVIQFGGNLLHSTNVGFSSTAPLSFIDQANNNGMSINSSGWNALYQNGTNTAQATIGKTQALVTIQQSSNVTGLVMDYSLGAVFHDDIFSRGINFAANYTTNQRLQRLSVPSVNTVIALADSVKGTISIPTSANPTATAGTTAINGTSLTFMRSDAAPKVDSTVFQTVANFFPKGDTRYYKSSNPSGYITGNQTITFTPTGDVTGSASGTTSLTPALSIGAGKVVNSMIAAGTIDLTAKVTGVLPVANGGTGTASPGIVAGTNVTVSGTWPNQTVNASGGVSFANPSGLIGLTAVNGSATTATRSDATHAIDQSITPTWTGVHTFSTTNTASSGTANYGTVFTHIGNQTSTAGFTDLFLNSTGTFGSGTHNLIDLRLGGSSKFSVTKDGNTSIAGTLNVSSTLSVGNGTTTTDFIVNGSNSGTTGGAGYFVQNNGTNIIQMGNYSALFGGTYNSTPTISASNTITITPQIHVIGGADFGNGTSNALVMNGGNSGTNGGGAVYVQNNGTSIIAIGNKSNISTGAYNAKPEIWANAGISVNQSIDIESTQTTVSGSTSGIAVYSQPFQGSTYKKVVVYLNALSGTSSYTFPTAFSQTPQIVTTNGPAAAIVTSLSTTSMTCTGAPTTGFIILEGY